MKVPSSSENTAFAASSLFPAGAVLGSVVWLYWPVLMGFSLRWEADPQYSHGPIIPFVAIGIVWLRGLPTDIRLRPSWAGLPLVLGGLLLKYFGRHFYLEWVESFSLLPVAAGACLMLAGWRLFLLYWPAVAFLVFMMPLPYRIESEVLQPLQNLATTASTFALQTLGYAARNQGNVVWIGSTPVGVAEACSGLRMLTGFVALAVAISLVVDRELWKRACLLLGAVPIGLLCNIIRVTSMGVVHSATADPEVHLTLHDVFGWLMPVGAAVLLWGLLAMLDRLFVEHDADAMGPPEFSENWKPARLSG